MTDVYFSKAELEFTHPLSEELVRHAAPRINQKLTALMEDIYDEETRLNDPRRIHTPLKHTIFRTDYGKDGITVTNQLLTGGDARQFRYLYYGNSSVPICSKGMTRRVLKGYNPKDRHKTVARGGKKTEAGDLGELRPAMLKFWSKRDGMWVYRRCVKPIGVGIIKNFQQNVKYAVMSALEEATWEASDEADITAELGTPDDIAAVQPVGTPEDFGQYSDTIEEVIYEDFGIIHTESEMRQVEDEQMTVASRHGQEQEGALRKFGNAAAGIKNYVLSLFGRR
jgi:hypothetical protein